MWEPIADRRDAPRGPESSGTGSPPSPFRGCNESRANDAGVDDYAEVFSGSAPGGLERLSQASRQYSMQALSQPNPAPAQ